MANERFSHHFLYLRATTPTGKRAIDISQVIYTQ